MPQRRMLMEYKPWSGSKVNWSTSENRSLSSSKAIATRLPNSWTENGAHCLVLSGDDEEDMEGSFGRSLGGRSVYIRNCGSSQPARINCAINFITTPDPTQSGLQTPNKAVHSSRSKQLLSSADPRTTTLEK